MKRLTTARRIAVEDAIFAGKTALLMRKKLLQELQDQEEFIAYRQQYFDALQTIQDQLKLPKSKAIRLLDGKIDFEDLFADGKAVIGDE